jgi:hypothetical protein
MYVAKGLCRSAVRFDVSRQLSQACNAKSRLPKGSYDLVGAAYEPGVAHQRICR